MTDVALEVEELQEASTGKDSQNKGALPHELGVAHGKAPLHEDDQDWGWDPD
jgi:hypothetical protein